MRAALTMTVLALLAFPAQASEMNEDAAPQIIVQKLTDRHDFSGPLLKEARAASQVHIRSTIEQQLRAIRIRDDRAAFTLSTAAADDHFKTPQDYMRHLRKKKPSLYNHVHFEILQEGRNNPEVQKVKLIDRYGQEALAMFKMERNADGDWRIDNVVVLQSDQDPI